MNRSDNETTDIKRGLSMEDKEKLIRKELALYNHIRAVKKMNSSTFVVKGNEDKIITIKEIGFGNSEVLVQYNNYEIDVNDNDFLMRLYEGHNKRLILKKLNKYIYRVCRELDETSTI